MCARKYVLTTTLSPAFTVDNVIFGFDAGALKILLIRRSEAPYDDYWALPGYFVRQNEDLDEAAVRVLRETTGMERVYLEQLRTFGTPGRHAFGRVITVAYYSLVKIADFTPRADGLSREVKWHDLPVAGDLAFDHAEIVAAAVARLRASVHTHPVGFELLPPAFTLTELQHLYEAIWETTLEKRNFRKKMLSLQLLVELDRVQEGVAHRPARLYRFDEERYRRLQEEGFRLRL